MENLESKIEEAMEIESRISELQGDIEQINHQLSFHRDDVADGLVKKDRAWVRQASFALMAKGQEIRAEKTKLKYANMIITNLKKDKADERRAQNQSQKEANIKASNSEDRRIIEVMKEKLKAIMPNDEYVRFMQDVTLSAGVIR